MFVGLTAGVAVAVLLTGFAVFRDITATVHAGFKKTEDDTRANIRERMLDTPQDRSSGRGIWDSFLGRQMNSASTKNKSG